MNPVAIERFASSVSRFCRAHRRKIWLLCGLMLAVRLQAQSPATDETTAPADFFHGPFLKNLGNEIQYKGQRISDAIEKGGWDIYLSGYIDHLSFSYTKKQLSHLNSRGWGGGFGRSIVDKNGDIHEIYLIGFDDSHFHGQFMAGYTWTRYWQAADSGFYLGLGYTFFLFSRHDLTNYMPFPGLLPIVSLRYRRAEVFVTFIPRLGKDIQGDTIYVCSRIRF